MTKLSRIYLPTDWKVWTYQAVSGVMRWDFSNWDDGSLWGGVTQYGNMAEITGDITEIVINDGARPDDGFSFELYPATAQISLEYTSFDKSIMAEFYSGKRIAITCDNMNSYPYGEYGANTVFFDGFINDANINIDPVSKITTVTINASEFLANIANTQTNQIRGLSLTRNDTFSTGWRDNINFIARYYTWAAFTLGTLASSNNDTATKVSTIGEQIRDYCQAEMAYPYNVWIFSNINTGSGNYGRTTVMKTLATAGSSVWTVPANKIFGVQLSDDAINKPNSFNINFPNGTLYQVGSSSANALSGVTNVTLDLDLKDTSQAQNIINLFNSYKSSFRPITVDVRIAATYQTISYDSFHPNTGNLYSLPDNYVFNGTVIQFDLTSYGYTLAETKSIVIGHTHTITPDAWDVTYQLMKGL